MAEKAIAVLRESGDPRADRLVAKLKCYLERSARVVDQTRRRVLEGESVPATEKLVSIFEEHTDIIRKDARDTSVMVGDLAQRARLPCMHSL